MRRIDWSTGSDPAAVKTAAGDELRESSGTRLPSAGTEDLDLVRRLLAGDEAAFTSLVRLYQGRLLRLALVFVGDRMAAEDVVQETWVGVLNGLRAFEGRSSLRTWIFRILTNRAKTWAVREGRSIPFSALANPDDADEPAVEPDRFATGGGWTRPPRAWHADTPEHALLRAEVLNTIMQAIAALPASQRAVVTLRDIEGVGADETCNILGISETNQRVLLHRARSRLRRALESRLSKE